MKRVLVLLSIIGLVRAQMLAQGCSDAGVCTAGAIGQLHLWQDSTADVVDYRHFARLGYSYAIGEQSTTIMQTNAEISIGIGPRLSVQAKVPYIWAIGNLGENSGIGDLIGTISYAIVKERERNLTAVLGVRLPMGSSEAMNTVITTSGGIGRPLPMPYQTGLGTTDLLMGINARKGGWVAAVAYQHVLHQGNKNTFSHEAWSGNTDAPGYFESYHLERANDLVGRIQYAYGCGRLSLQPGLLGIYHLGMDSRLVLPQPSVWSNDTTPFRWVVGGSQGLTLNLTADLRYKLSEQWAIEAMFATPVVTREVRPDGLTRSLVTGFGLRYRF